ncbi:MAG: PilZ domain-containing protein [bacterium]|nr:PilZ domain-containing protein [bacterium]
MIGGAIAQDDRFCVEKHYIGADYTLISGGLQALPDAALFEDTHRRQRQSVLQNLGFGGACLCIGHEDLDLGRQIALRILLDPPLAANARHPVICLAQVIWLLESAECRKVGLQFFAVPLDFADVMSRVGAVSEPCHP